MYAIMETCGAVRLAIIRLSWAQGAVVVGMDIVSPEDYLNNHYWIEVRR